MAFSRKIYIFFKRNMKTCSPNSEINLYATIVKPSGDRGEVQFADSGNAVGSHV